jgi:hypothetical protein
MRKVYKYKKGSCGLCHPHKKKWAKKSEGKKQELQEITRKAEAESIELMGISTLFM